MDVFDLAVNGRVDRPLGVDDPQPSLSWRLSGNDRGLHQTAYQVRVADDEQALQAGRCSWDSGKVPSGQHSHIAYGGPALTSRQAVAWQVRVWDEQDRCSPWSEPSGWEMGLLTRADWGEARWIEHPDRDEADPLPIFARSFDCPPRRVVRRARLYLAGLGVHEATVNGQPVTDEVLAPGNSNYQRSVEYRVYDTTGLLTGGRNTLGIALGYGTAYVHRTGTNPTTGRESVYAWWTSHRTGRATLTAPAPVGATAVVLDTADGFRVDATINVGEAPESRRITAVDGSRISFRPALESAHDKGAPASASGDPVADVEPSAAAAVTPRLLARLEVDYTDGLSDVICTDGHWRTALGPVVTDHWYSGTDYDARREQAGWDSPDTDLSSSARRRDGQPTGWVDARPTAPPSLSTELVWRAGEPVRIVAEWDPLSVTSPAPGVWVFDLGQNFAGWPELRLDRGVPQGTVIVMRPAESLRPDGTVDQCSLHNPQRGTDVFHAYIAWGSRDGERWRPRFQYFGMRYLQVTGFPEGYVPTRSTIRCLRLRADVRPSGSVSTSDERINRIHQMVRHSIASNVLSVLTDCPGREKLAYGADYTHPIGVLVRNFDFTAYLTTMQRHLVEAQSKRGNVALKAPVYDWGYLGEFGDEINWGNAIIQVPWILYENYGDTRTMVKYYPQMQAFLRYITTQKARGHIVEGPLGDWVASEQTSGDITGTWGYYLSCRYLAKMAAVLGDKEGATFYHALARKVGAAFNARFFDSDLGCYTGDGTSAGATQAAQALPLDAGLVPEEFRKSVVDALVDRVYAYNPFGGKAHVSVGHIGLGPLVRALSAADRDDVLWDVLCEETPPSYGYFLRSTPRNPGGLTTIPEQWDLRNSLNHMILTGIDEWFHAGLAGIRQAADSTGYRRLVVKPKVVGDLNSVHGWYDAPAGRISVRWRRSAGNFVLEVEIPPNTVAEIWMPGRDCRAVGGVPADRSAAEHTVYRIESGAYTFRSALN